MSRAQGPKKAYYVCNIKTVLKEVSKLSHPPAGSDDDDSPIPNSCFPYNLPRARSIVGIFKCRFRYSIIRLYSAPPILSAPPLGLVFNVFCWCGLWFIYSLLSSLSLSLSLAPGVGGRAPGIGGRFVFWVGDGAGFLAVPGRLAVFGLSAKLVVFRALSSWGLLKVSPLIALRERGLGARSGTAEVALSRSSVARRASSRALSSDVCVETSLFLGVVLVNISRQSVGQGTEEGSILLVNCSI